MRLIDSDKNVYQIAIDKVIDIKVIDQLNIPLYRLKIQFIDQDLDIKFKTKEERNLQLDPLIKQIDIKNL